MSCAGEPLLVVSMSEQIMDSTTGEAYSNYVLAGGSSDFISDARLRGGYANKDILYAMLRSMVVDNVDTESANISFREYTGEALDITEGEANGNMNSGLRRDPPADSRRGRSRVYQAPGISEKRETPERKRA